MNTKQILLLILLATVLQTAELFLQPGFNHSNNHTITFVTNSLLALLLCLFTKLRLGTIALIVIIGSVLANIIKVVVDVYFDPTAHNLFPLEIVITAMIAGITALFGIAVGWLAKRIRTTFFR